MQVRVQTAGRIFDSRIRPMRSDGEVVGAVGVALDVTEAAREAERAEFRARLLDHVGDAVVVTDAETRIIYWNDAAEEIFG